MKTTLLDYLKTNLSAADYEKLSENLKLSKTIITRLVVKNTGDWTDDDFENLIKYLCRINLLNISPAEFLQKYCPNNVVTVNKLNSLQKWFESVAKLETT